MLTLAEVEHIATLARLELTAEEKERYRQQLSAILDYAASLQELDTSGIPPTSSVLPPAQRRLSPPAQRRLSPPRSGLRPDVAAPGLTRDELLRNAPQTSDDQFRVPPVLDQEP